MLASCNFDSVRTGGPGLEHAIPDLEQHCHHVQKDEPDDKCVESRD